ncbi:MAG: helix-turn-helix domain-containing protein [Polyangiaceae bacterium]
MTSDAPELTVLQKQVVHALSAAGRTLSSLEVANLVGVNRSEALRCLAELHRLQIVRRPFRDKYRLTKARN